MAKKRIHTYHSGDIVTFKFLTGDVYTGKITYQTFKEDGTPTYKIKVEDSKGFTIYPCMTDERIIKRENTSSSKFWQLLFTLAGSKPNSNRRAS